MFKTVAVDLAPALAAFLKAHRTDSTSEGVWLKMTYELWNAKSGSLPKSFMLYYVNHEADTIVLCWRRDPAATKIAPSPNTTMSSHLAVYAKGRDGRTYILTTVEGADASSAAHSGLPGGHIDLKDASPLMGLHREIQEELGFELFGRVKGKRDRPVVLARIRLIPQYKRLNGVFESKDIWFLYKMRVPLHMLRQIAIHPISNGDGEIKSLEVVDLAKCADNWWSTHTKEVLVGESNGKGDELLVVSS